MEQHRIVTLGSAHESVLWLFLISAQSSGYSSSPTFPSASELSPKHVSFLTILIPLMILPICRWMFPKLVSPSQISPLKATRVDTCLLDLDPYIFNRHNKVKVIKSEFLIFRSKCVLPLAFFGWLNGNPILYCSSPKPWIHHWLLFFSHPPHSIWQQILISFYSK